MSRLQMRRRGRLGAAAVLVAAALCCLGALALAPASGMASPSPSPNPDPLPCSSFDPSRIKLVTFDVFAALMDIFGSLERTIPPMMAPAGVPAATARRFADDMVRAYGKYNNHKFTRAQTGGLEPFLYVANQSVTALVGQLGLQKAVPPGGPLFDRLVHSWGDLTPWPGTADALAKLAPHYRLAPLSNGNAETLRDATSVFAPRANMSYIFSSNWPVGAFKPQPAMYEQLLNRTGLARDEVLHVAGAPGDGRGARDYGLYSALLRNPPVPGRQPCFVLQNITELLPILLPARQAVDDGAPRQL